MLAIHAHLPGNQSRTSCQTLAQHRPHHEQDVIYTAACSLHDIAIKNERLIQLHKSHFLCFQNDCLSHYVIITTITTIISIIICNIKLSIGWIHMEKLLYPLGPEVAICRVSSAQHAPEVAQQAASSQAMIPRQAEGDRPA